MIFTFYSYKGGVGRSMALANVAEWLYSNGARVLMIDWDLEAPGLESFFYRSEADLDAVRNKQGLVDLLLEYKRQHALAVRDSKSGNRDDIHRATVSNLKPLERWMHAIHSTAGPSGALWLLPAGLRQNRFAEYAESVADFDWAEFYADYEGEAFFSWLRTQVAPGFDALNQPHSGFADVVLIDSRTGATEMGGVCTQQLADVVVAFTAPNMQNLLGVEAMANAFRRPEILQSRGGKPEVIIVPSRVDVSELESRNRFEQRLKSVESQFLPEILKSLERSFWDLRIPYVAKFAYEEALTIASPSYGGRFIEATEMASAYKQLAATMVMLTPPTHVLRGYLAQDTSMLFERKRVYLTWADVSGMEIATRIRSHLTEEAPDIDAFSPPLEMAWTAVQSQINQEIATASSVLIAITTEALSSDRIRDEWRFARSNGICVYGVYEGVSPSPLPPWIRRAKLFDLHQASASLIRTLRSPCVALRVPFMAPDVPAPYVERPEILGQLRRTILSSRGEPNTVRCVLRGTGGTGKSTVAAALCHDRAIVDAFDDGILWVTLGSKADVRESLTQIYAALTGERASFASESGASYGLSTRLASLSCLVVIDDVWNPSDVNWFFQAAKQSTCVITSRNSGVAPDAITVDVGMMTAEEAIAYLSSGFAVTNPEALTQLAHQLSGLPVAVKAARDVLNERVLQGDSLERASAYLQEVLGRNGLQYFEAVNRIVQTSVEHIPTEARERFYAMAALPENQPVPVASVASLWSVDRIEAEAQLQQLARFSLIKFDPSSQTMLLHPAAFAWLQATARQVRLVDIQLTKIVVPPRVTVAFDDGSEMHGAFVSTRAWHSLELPDVFNLATEPVTNEGFAVFVRAGGYTNDAFWPSVPRRIRRNFLAHDGQNFGPATWPTAECPSDRARHPVAGICYYEAVAFTTWLNDVQRHSDWLWILPTEDMWEFAARGPDARVYPWGNAFRPDVCNSAEQQIGSTTPVGDFPAGAGPFGVLDLAGNVWEFVDAADQPTWGCVLRGGSFLNTSDQVKSTLRLFNVPRDHRAPDFGFRCAQQPRSA
jgi:formylglycine-generating enzyme required for sulfatase activity